MSGDLGQLGFLSPAGDQAAFTSWGAFAGMPLTGEPQPYVAHRGADGVWRTTPVVAQPDNGVKAVADATPTVLWQATVGSGFTSDLLLRDGAGAVTSLTPTSGNSPLFAAATGDLSTIFFQTTTNLLPGDDHTAAGRTRLYEWRAGTLSVVPDPSATTPSNGRGVQIGGGAPPVGCPGCAPRALSADGNRIVASSFTTGNKAQLYIRQDGEAPVPLTAAPSQDETLDGASADLSTIVFSTKQ